MTHAKRCSPLDFSSLESGLGLRETRVLLGTLAQFHAVGLAWKLNRTMAAAVEAAASKAGGVTADSDALAFLLREGGPGIGDNLRGVGGRPSAVNGSSSDDDGAAAAAAAAAREVLCGCGDCDACAVTDLLSMYDRFLRWQQKIRRRKRNNRSGGGGGRGGGGQE